jgi:hypothetical protein
MVQEQDASAVPAGPEPESLLERPRPRSGSGSSCARPVKVAGTPGSGDGRRATAGWYDTCKQHVEVVFLTETVMKETAILVVAGLLWAYGSTAADEPGDRSRDPQSGKSARPSPPQILESPAAGEPPADSSGTADNGMSAVRESLLRKNVVTVDGDEIGVVRDIGYSAAYGEPIAVVEVDAFIGIGEKLIAIPLSQLQSAEMYSSSVMTTFTRDAIEAEEAFDEEKFVAIE